MCECYLRVRKRVSHQQQAGLHEFLLDLVGEGAWGVATTNVLGAGVLSKFKHRALAKLASRHNDHIFRVLNGNDDPCGEHQLLPGLAEVDDVHTILAAAPHIALHVGVAVLGAKVDIGSQEEFEVLLTEGWE